jgi:short-subunit dehydrogenase
MDLRNKIILITGAAHGLGHELALLLDQEGCVLILVDRDEINIASFQNARTLTCDLSDLVQRKKLIESVNMKVDILINCAGVGSHSQLSQINVDEIGTVMQINTLAPLELIVGLSPLELVVNIGSVAGEMSLPSMSLYAASKSSIHAFTRAIHLEGARTLLVILGPLRGTDFVKSIQHPRTGQPQWYRDLDLPVEKAACLIVRAIKRGSSQIIAPWWYGIVFVAWRILSPVAGWFR